MPEGQKAGPKGRQLEVGAQRAPRLLVWYIFERRIVQGYQKLYSHESNMQIQKYKYTNTSYDEVPEKPNMWYIYEKRIVRGYQK